MVNQEITSLMASFIAGHPRFKDMSEDGIFSAMCMKHLFFANPLTPFADDVCDRYIVDGTRDGGIDAVFRNPDADENEVVIIQGKCYSETNPVSKRLLRSELDKLINKTLKGFCRNKYEHVREAVKRRYFEAVGEIEVDDIQYHIVFCTSWTPATMDMRRALIKICNEYCDRRYNVEIKFGDDIARAADNSDLRDECVKKGVLRLFGRPGHLRYGNDDAVIVNISAQSLADAFKREKAILGMNLRYHINKAKIYKDVDNGMLATIRNNPESFWFYNNGLVVVCRSFRIDGRNLVLRGYSIVNGGQTTYNIAEAAGTTKLPKDFAVLCKVVKAKGTTANKRSEFCRRIAEFTNSQKPIKPSDLKANMPEQCRMAVALERCGVFYVRKAGLLPPPTFKSYMVANIERIGKMGLAIVALLPADARNKLSTMFEEDVYRSIYVSRVSPMVYSNALLLSKRFQQFKNLISNQTGRLGKGRWFGEVGVSVVCNCETFVLATIGLLAKFKYGALTKSEYNSGRKNEDALLQRKSFSRMIEVRQLFEAREDDFDCDDRFHPLFRELCKQFEKVYSRKCRELEKVPDVSAFFKRNNNFHDKGMIADVILSLYAKPHSALRTYCSKCLGW